MASTWYSSSRRSFISEPLIAFRSAFIAASTGPTPTPASTTSSPSISNLIDAVGYTFLPDTTDRSRSFIRSLRSICSTSSTIAWKSESVTNLPLSPSSFTFDRMVISCGSSAVTPISSSAIFTAALPVCLPNANRLFLPIRPGSMGSYKLVSASVPWICIPDSWVKTLSPMSGLFGATGIFVRLRTNREVSYSFSFTIPLFTP